MKNTTKKVLLIFVLSTALFSADESIDIQIQKIKNAPPQERVELMNQFKKHLREMNQEERATALANLRNAQSNAKVQNRSNEMLRDTQLIQQNNAEQMNQRESVKQWNANKQHETFVTQPPTNENPISFSVVK